jgi:hypothetical protein
MWFEMFLQTLGLVSIDSDELSSSACYTLLEIK